MSQLTQAGGAGPHHLACLLSKMIQSNKRSRLLTRLDIVPSDWGRKN